MARKLNAYQTSLGFFDLAIAAPSMKAAAEAWGGKTEDFKRGFAKQTDDPEILDATMAKPGVVLKRPVGSTGRFAEHAKLPKDLPAEINERSTKIQQEEKKKKPIGKVDNKATRAAALAFEREQKRRETARRKEAAAREKERQKRDEAIVEAERALELATRRHALKSKEFEGQRVLLGKRSQAEETRWEKEREKLESAVRRARD